MFDVKMFCNRAKKKYAYDLLLVVYTFLKPQTTIVDDVKKKKKNLTPYDVVIFVRN